MLRPDIMDAAPESARVEEVLATDSLDFGGLTRFPIRRFRLNVLTGPDAGTEFVSSGEREVIGSHVSADLVLADRAVSRFHCELSCAEGRILIRDLGSRNGTRVNSVP